MKNESIPNIKINNKYIILEKLGSGSFGIIYKGQNTRTGENVAIKVEPLKNNTKLLKNESIIYHYLLGLKGIPNVKWFGKDEYNYYMVIDLLGNSLEDIKITRGTFSLKLVLQVGIQCIDLLERLHEKKLIHRDIKPDNFLLGIKNNIKQIYLIDFGFCKTFDIKNATKYSNNLIGTPIFASINAHEFRELSFADDMESLGYMLIYLFLDTLPWQKENMTKDEFIRMKKNIYNDTRIPIVLLKYIKIVSLLTFDERPNYNKLKSNFYQEYEILTRLNDI